MMMMIIINIISAIVIKINFSSSTIQSSIHFQ